MARYINVEDIVLRGICAYDEDNELLIPLTDVRKAIQLTPTADVVSRIEIAKAIFSEIDDMLGNLTIPIVYPDGHQQVLQSSCVVVEYNEYKKIKKKYTEVSNENTNT